MASLVWDRAAGGRRARILVLVSDRRVAIRLGRVPAKVAEEWKRRVEELVANLVGGVAPDASLAAWLRNLPEQAHERLSRCGLVPARICEKKTTHTLGLLCDAFKARAAVKPGTAAAYDQTLDSLRAFYGLDKPIDEITRVSADEWRKAIAEATASEGRRKKKRVGADGRLAPATIAKRTAVAKQVFAKAVSWGWLDSNPFAGLRVGSQANPARARYIPPEALEAVLEACPGLQWRLAFALPRLAGLRCPSEIGGLAWGDVDFAKGRLTVRSPKTEHHGGGHAVRLVPIVPRLREILADAFDAATPGDRLVVPMAARHGANLRTTAEKVIERAGLEQWPRLFQNLRASCETDWVQKYPAHVCAKWLGHSPTIAATHYLQVRDAHFADAISGGAEGSNQGGAESGARTAHFQAQQPSAKGRKVSRTQTGIAKNPEGNSVPLGAGENRRKILVGSTGFEEPSFDGQETQNPSRGGAQSGAPLADSDLAEVVAAWGSLPPSERVAILVRVRTAMEPPHPGRPE